MMRVRMMLAIAFMALLTITCKKKEPAPTPDSYPVQFRLTDAPGPYEEVWVDVQGVEVHVDENDNGQGWTTLNTKKGKYDLISLANGRDTLLADATLPYGKISQVRLILGNDNSVKIGGQVYLLETPSAQQSGLKVKLNSTLTKGINYLIWLDFDAAKSIVEKGNGKYSLKPVIRAVPQATSGAIKGMVTPVAAKSFVYAIQGTDSISTVTDPTGGFMLRGLPAGSYTVMAQPASPPYNAKTLTNVAVTVGKVTDVGYIDVN
jgi:hypothetical protein